MFCKKMMHFLFFRTMRFNRGYMDQTQVETLNYIIKLWFVLNALFIFFLIMYMNTQFNRLDARFEKIHKRFDRIEEKITDIDRRLCRLEGAFSTKDCCVMKESKTLRKAE